MSKFFMEPIHGSVQTWEEWVKESKGWDSECDWGCDCLSIEDQLSSLIEVAKNAQGEWEEVK